MNELEAGAMGALGDMLPDMKMLAALVVGSLVYKFPELDDIRTDLTENLKGKSWQEFNNPLSLSRYIYIYI